MPSGQSVQFLGNRGNANPALLQDQPPESENDEVDRLIEQLSHQDFAIREAAVERLVSLKKQSVSKLFVVVKQGDQPQETKTRCRQIILRLAKIAEPELQQAIVKEIDDLLQQPLGSADPNLKMAVEAGQQIRRSDKDPIARLRKLGVRIYDSPDSIGVAVEEFLGDDPNELENLTSLVAKPISLTVNDETPAIIYEILPRLNLHSLDVNGSANQTLGTSKLEQLSQNLFECKNLTALRISAAVPDDFYKVLVRLPQLQHFVVPSHCADSHFVEIAKLKNLESLRFSFTEKIMGPGFQSLIELKSLRHLDLGALSWKPKFKAYLKQMQQLETLKLPQLSTDVAITAILPLKSLRRLIVDNSFFTDAGLAKLVELDRLEVLSINEAWVSDESIATINKMESLQQLSLSRTLITQAGYDRIRCADSKLSHPFVIGKQTHYDLIRQMVAANIFVGGTGRKKDPFVAILNAGLPIRQPDLIPKLKELNIKTLWINRPVTNEESVQLCKLSSDTTVYLTYPTSENPIDPGRDRLIQHFETIRTPK